MRKQLLVATLSIFVIALCARAVFLFSSPDRDWPHSMLYEGDAPVWVHWAQALDRGEPFELDLPLRTPAVAYAMHWLSPGVLQGPFLSYKMLWCAISAAGCALLFVFARRHHGAIAAWTAAGLACFSFGGYVTATSLNNEAPYTLVLLAILLLSIRLLTRPSTGLAVGLGCLHGVALLLRAEHLLLLLFLLAFPVGSLGAARTARLAGAVAAAALAVCLPWLVRGHVMVERFNVETRFEPDWSHASPPWTPEARAYLEGLPAFARGPNFSFLQALARERGARDVGRDDVDRFFREEFGYVPEPIAAWGPTSRLGPLDFALANHAGADGGFSLDALSDSLDAEPSLSFARPSHLRLFNHGYAVGTAWIRSDPRGFAALAGRKLSRFADGATLGLGASNWPFGRESVRHAVDVATPLPGRGGAWKTALALAVLLGAALAWRTPAGAILGIVLAYKLVVTVLFFGYARQAVSIGPVLFLLAGISVERLAHAVRAREKTLALAGAAVVLTLCAGDVGVAMSAHPLVARAVSPGVAILPAPEWGAGAFEVVPDIEITPR